LHWDTTDGVFAATGGFDAERARALTHATGLVAEAHLMVRHPAKEVDKWTDFCDLVVVHVESKDWQRAVDRISARDCLPGIAISPETPIHALPDGLPVLCMTIKPGTAGSPFDETGLARLTHLRKTCSERRIGLDGGVQRRHLELAEHDGADWLVVGTDLFFRNGERRWADALRSGQAPTWRQGGER
jgi:ribulose-phosphate 3-epimerase